MKHRLSALIPLVLGLSLLASCASQSVTARTVIDRYLDVSGTRDIEFESMQSSGTIEIVGMGVEGTTETYLQRPNMIYTVVEMSLVGTVQTGYDGETAWRTHPMMGETILEGAELEQLLRRTSGLRFAFKDPEGYEVIELLEDVEFGGELCHKVRFVETPYAGLDDDETFKLREFFEYYSVESGLLLGTEGVSSSPQGDIPSTSTMSEYIELGGVVVPGMTHIEAAGITIEAKTNSVVYDDVDPKVFELPKAIQALRDAKSVPAQG